MFESQYAGRYFYSWEASAGITRLASVVSLWLSLVIERASRVFVQHALPAKVSAWLLVIRERGLR